MTLRVYNTLSRQKELFEPVRPGKVGMYLCGPTVYKSPHIGHMVGPIIFDAVKRYLQYKGFEVTWVTNITDVDDKLIDAARRQNTTMQELAEKHTREYFECLAALGIASIDKFPRASDHIAEIIEMCQMLISGGTAYAVGGNVWFDVTKDADYGKLSHRRVEEQASGLRDLEGEGKRHPADFALWKAAKADEPSWPSPWGPGRPGWHIECSAMSMKYLGTSFDIHGGGMDLMFPHHENELAQSESATGQPFVRYWLHNGITKVRTKARSGEWKSEDMHESAGNAVRVRDLLDRHGPDLIRYLLLSSHYRSPIDFSDEVLASARKGLAAFDRLFERVERITGKAMTDKSDDMDRGASELLESEGHAAFAKAILALKMKFLETMDDDFNTGGAIGVLHEVANEINSFVERHDVEKKKPPVLVAATGAAAHTLRNLGMVLGLFAHGSRASAAATAASGGDAKGDGGTLAQVMDLMIKLRQEARAGKNFALADRIRDGLTAVGITLEDRADGTGWRKG
jgi:cysteinyl-tRNA synthetase